MRKYTRLSIIVCALFSVKAYSADLPDASNKKSELGTDVRKYDYQGLHVGFFWSVGTSYPNSVFSTLPGGVLPEYGSADSLGAYGALYFSNEGAIVFGISGSSKEIGFKDSSATAKYNTKFTELELGYRFQADLFFAEGGIVYGMKSGQWTVSVVSPTVSGSGTPSLITKLNDLVGFYMAAGISYPVTNNLFLNGLVKYQQAISPVVDFPETQGVGWKLTPTTLSLQLGMGIRF